MKRFLLPLCLMLAGCALSKPAAPLREHDLGPMFETPAGRAPVVLRKLSVSAAPQLSGLSMHYREAAHPTRLGSYVQHRWVTPPPNLVRQAMLRLLPQEPGERCSLMVLLNEFNVDIDAGGAARAVLASELKLSRDGQEILRRPADLRVPMPRPAPGEGALALREATIRLSQCIADWLTQAQVRERCAD
ncbi:MAG: hypothetical protein CGU28_10630 [Candidatus Dactylopiibacterium carminicum]|uniref:ABC-type transport auxiliary lipoprotein component domain-containing protein n=1 Tax=Candidatus Dactylopiibacterium carminicum TaxID=857335 RepID=A0A272ETK8_9RHOO|nr:hypothetical protein [Candidatus Dactylopiibacterium carminicum]KAF7599424.1 hypothetical protein BGI27_08175 [Candidatus Dactylopiibacterium carminicum]PAS93418.1 MAG: hypothetical protein CGU29_07645 [Candidatus Dactylopiibacterium carminicum]PAS95937.1 MAG: hypothetical protein CGU28_10630 [Candidatus Dactylopiibacterium carminicum]PAS99432.1 MAG: hypothetical protein BSR46_08200 [Candidatus Dactylopiibacterium carminicum]